MFKSIRPLLAVLTLLAALPAGAQRQPFSQPIEIPPLFLYGIGHPIDFNNDGIWDIYDGYSVIYENAGKVRPTFTQRNITLKCPFISSTISNFRIIAFYDFDNDGQPDIIAQVTERLNDEDYGYSTGEYLVWGKHLGNAQYDCHVIDSGRSGSTADTDYRDTFQDLILVDWDRDGRMDILYDVEHREEYWYSYSCTAVSKVAQNFGGNPITFQVGPFQTRYLKGPKWVGDLNHDGVLDLVGFRYDDGENSAGTGNSHYYTNVQMVLGTRAGNTDLISSYTLLRDFGHVNPWYQSKGYADFNGDGYTDILLSDGYMQNPGATPNNWTMHTLSQDTNLGLVPGLGFMGEGIPQMIGATDSGYYLGERNPYLPSEVDNHPLFDNTILSSVNFIFDADHDGKLDIIGSKYHDATNSLRFLHNEGTLPFKTYHPIGFDASYQDFSLGDFDGDGYPDLIFTIHRTWWLQNQYSQIFTSHTLAAANGVVAVWPVDLDKDGRVDILSSAAADNKILWHRNTGAPDTPFQTYTLTIQVANPYDVCAADLNGDGLPDFVVASRDDNTVCWFKNLGGMPPAFEKHVLTSGATGVWAVATADLDGDGDIDVMAASPDNDTFWWFENSGGAAPVFTVHKLATDAGGARAITAADLDGDGHPDILTGARDDNTIAWYRSDGKTPPAFTRHVITTSSIGIRCLAVADLNHDGHLDIAAASAGDNTIAWYESDGASPPAFTRHVIDTQAIGTVSVSVQDLDGDGFPDLLASFTKDNALVWYRNDGQTPPHFTRRTIDLGALDPREAIAADLNGDGKPDVVSALCGSNAVQWYENIPWSKDSRNNAKSWKYYH